MRWLLTLLLALGLAPPSSAATYHVAQRSTAASDENSGTARQPWKTLARATRHLLPGDIVLVHAGVYRETLAIRNSGTASAPITLRAAEGEQPVISGADEVRNWVRVPGQDPIYRTLWDHVFAIDWHDGQPVRVHGAEAPVGRAEQAFWWGKPLRMVMRREQLAPDTFFIDDGGKVLYAWFPEEPSRGGAELSTRQLLCESRSSAPDQNREVSARFISLQGLTFRYAANFAQRGGVNIAGGHWRVEDCVFEKMNGPGASITGSDHVLRRCTFRENGQLGFGASRAHRLRVEQCRLLRNNVKGFSSGWEAGGCKITMSRGAVMDRCVARDNAGPGFWYDIGNESSLVQNCFAANNEVGLMYEISYGLTARNNLMVGNGDPRGPAWGTGGIMVSSSPGCLLEHNLCSGNRDGIAFREQDRTTPRIDARPGAEEEPVFCARETVRQNLLAFNEGYQLAFWFDTRFFGPHPSGADTRAPLGANPASRGFTLTDNLLFAAPDQGMLLYGAPWRSGSVHPLTLGGFEQATGIPASGRIADPLFRDAAAGDFSLRSESPAIKQGAGLSDPALIPR
jgi:parallel beta-helix repeat protein